MRSQNENSGGGQVEALVLGRLRGELGAAEEALLARLLAADPRQAAAAAALERAWNGLELPPCTGTSVAPQVLARLRAEQRAGAAAPAWARLAAAAALVAGVGLGLGLDLDPPAGQEIVENAPLGEEDLFGGDEDLAGESLWLAAEDDLQDEGEIQ